MAARAKVVQPPVGVDTTALTAPEQPGAVKVESPAGFVTEVPESIVAALLESGYSQVK